MVDMLPAILRLDEGEVGVEVAVRLLGRGDLIDDGVGAFLQVRVAPGGESIGDPLDHLVKVGIVEEQSLVLTRFELAGHGEIFDAAGDLALVQVRLDGLGAVGLQARSPEGVLDLHRGERNGL